MPGLDDRLGHAELAGDSPPLGRGLRLEDLRQLLRKLLRARVPLSEHDVARATGVDEATVREWIERKSPPTGVRANRLNELIAVVGPDGAARHYEHRFQPAEIEAEATAAGLTVAFHDDSGDGNLVLVRA